MLRRGEEVPRRATAALGLPPGAWSPGLGDASLVGWFTVVAYAASAFLCWRALVAARRARRTGRRSAVLFWAVLLGGTLALGVNKQLDLQSGVAELGRALVRALGWQEHRTPVKVALVAVGLLIGGGLCAGLAYAGRHEVRRVLLALFGWTTLCVFVSVRAISFHNVDRFFGMDVGGARLGAVLELGGIAVLAAGALLYLRSAREGGARAAPARGAPPDGP
jgi:hypothetical protein